MNSRVIYIGTFSKILFPSLRIGYIVIPRDLVDHFLSVRFAMDIFPPYLYQEVLADFMSLGHFGRHIRKMRQVYSARRSTIVDCLQAEFGDKLPVHGAAAGMHVTVTLPDGLDDQRDCGPCCMRPTVAFPPLADIRRKATQERICSWIWKHRQRTDSVRCKTNALDHFWLRPCQPYCVHLVFHFW